MIHTVAALASPQISGQAKIATRSSTGIIDPKTLNVPSSVAAMTMGTKGRPVIRTPTAEPIAVIMPTRGTFPRSRRAVNKRARPPTPATDGAMKPVGMSPQTSQ
jgi:hypothetical protein